MALGLRLLAMYMRRLDPNGDDGRPPAARARRPRAAAAPGESCGAQMRDGSPCPRPPVEGGRRCRSHGGAPGAGAPKGNRNALKHGRFTAKELAYGRRISEFIRESRETIRDVNRATRGTRIG
jgi:glucans biosynthesis protein